jgi:hypothetical protein
VPEACITSSTSDGLDYWTLSACTSTPKINLESAVKVWKIISTRIKAHFQYVRIIKKQSFLLRIIHVTNN